MLARNAAESRHSILFLLNDQSTKTGETGRVGLGKTRVGF
jgi:hypothetical protein